MPERLPQVFMAKVFSCLSWMDKMNAVEVVPAWSASLCSVEAWPRVANNPSNVLSVSEKHEAMWCECICNYGRYFRNCHLTIPMPDPSEKAMVLLGQVAYHCRNLQSFDLRNPFCFSLSRRDQERYVEHLKSIASKLRKFSCMSLLNMNYIPQDVNKGVGELLGQLVQSGIQEHLRVLEFFSHPNGVTQTIALLADFQALQKLKCPIQVLDTNLVLTLAGNGLRELHVVNDMSTHNEGFVDRISWEDISKSTSQLRVQYIVQEREWLDSDLVPNPLIYSYVMDSLSYRVSEALFEGIAMHYGSSLERFAHLFPDHADWDHIPYNGVAEVQRPMIGWPMTNHGGIPPWTNQRNMYAELARCCPLLREVVLGLQFPAEALVRIAANRKQCRVCVDEARIVFDDLCYTPSEADNDDRPVLCVGVTSLQCMMSKHLGYEWRPLHPEEYKDIVTNITCLSPDWSMEPSFT